MEFFSLKSIPEFTAETPSKKQTNIAEKIEFAKWNGRVFEIYSNRELKSLLA